MNIFSIVEVLGAHNLVMVLFYLARKIAHITWDDLTHVGDKIKQYLVYFGRGLEVFLAFLYSLFVKTLIDSFFHFNKIVH